ncbi:MAG: glycogen synthase GlgA [Hyphomicrobiales bacterium]|nr:glycogen synthase GlgA [Hyphomicrobiales bacterium]
MSSSPSGSGNLIDAQPTARRKVLFVTSEISDYVQTGGLGEVSAALPRALASLCDVRILIPGYRQVLARHDSIETVATLPPAGDIPACTLGKVKTHDGLCVYIVMAPDLFDRPGGPYLDEDGNDWPDNDIRFARLSLAAAAIAEGTGEPSWRPDNVHLNDWPSALAAGYMAWKGIRVPALLTIHNLAYQGAFDRSRLKALAIPESAFDINGVEFFGKLSYLKAGLFYSTHLTTVSSTYANEITTAEFGCGMHGLLRERQSQGRLTGILNGIDESWDPRNPSYDDQFDSSRWKGRHADYVRGAFGLAMSRGPLFAIVSRLVHQKGVDLALEVAEDIVEKGGQIVVTGKGDATFENHMRALAAKYRGSVGVRIGFDSKDARAMFAGSDFLLMPSRFEPCGLSQMYAQRFGSLPIAHKTGGLADTIEDGRTGFLFGAPTAGGLQAAVHRAFDTFSSADRFSRMREEAMSRRFDWLESANRYTGLYERAA